MASESYAENMCNACNAIKTQIELPSQSHSFAIHESLSEVVSTQPSRFLEAI